MMGRLDDETIALAFPDAARVGTQIANDGSARTVFELLRRHPVRGAIYATLAMGLPPRRSSSGTLR